jgi:hypothetical protein
MGGSGTCLVVNAQLATPAGMSCKGTVDRDGMRDFELAPSDDSGPWLGSDLGRERQ